MKVIIRNDLVRRRSNLGWVISIGAFIRQERLDWVKLG